jgi:hypothetical protein
MLALNKNRRKGGKGRKASKKGNRKSEFARWLSWMRKNSGDFERLSGNGVVLFFPYSTGPEPPRMPSPAGPVGQISSGQAQFSTTQFMNGYSASTGIGISGDDYRISQNSATPIAGQIAFTLGDLAQSNVLTDLFDQYRIDFVQCRFRALQNAVDETGLSPFNRSPSIYVVVDRDDATVPSSQDQLMQYDNCHQYMGTDSFDVILEPSLTPALFNTGVFDGYSVAPSKSIWVDCANAQVPFYGIKFWITGLEPSSSGQQWSWEVNTLIKISFKNTR